MLRHNWPLEHVPSIKCGAAGAVASASTIDRRRLNYFSADEFAKRREYKKKKLSKNILSKYLLCFLLLLNSASIEKFSGSDANTTT